ncbi:MAG: hypothetical protein C0434_17680 [Xanthomonadaceae bacterium]|nr:hypothetical protein [Xanthomonadaceae bacterium]
MKTMMLTKADARLCKMLKSGERIELMERIGGELVTLGHLVPGSGRPTAVKAPERAPAKRSRPRKAQRKAAAKAARKAAPKARRKPAKASTSKAKGNAGAAFAVRMKAARAAAARRRK